MRNLWASLFVVLVLAGCAGGPQRVERVDLETEAAEVELDGFFEGEELAVVGAKPASAVEAFLVGESLVWAGDVEGAYEVYVGMLRDFPGHGLNRYGAFRLYEMRYEVVDFAERAYRDLKGLRFDGEWALTQEMLAKLSHHIELERWYGGDAEEPFEHGSSGVIRAWRGTPRLSAYRLLDFEEVFEPEVEERLQGRYLSPQYGVDSPENWENLQLIYQEEPGEGLNLGRQGIYYLESSLEVERGGKFWMSGHFPGAAKVWVGSEEVLKYGEEEIGDARVLREVELGAGSHRVLVKLAYQPRMRDWFELYFVPQSGEVFEDLGLRESLEVGQERGRMRVLGPQVEAMELEPVVVSQEELEQAGDLSIYAGALSAYMSGDSAAFDEVWSALNARRPGFVGAYLLGSDQVRTRWEVPAEHRESAAIRLLRQALELEPENLRGLVRLERRLRDQGGDRELKQLLEAAKEQAFVGDGEERRLRQVGPLKNWARFVEQKGWGVEAEEAWQEVLAVDGGDCGAAARLQGLYRQRNYLPAPSEFMERWRGCSAVVERWLRADSSRSQEWAEYARWQGRRNPLATQRQLDWAQALREVGDLEGAEQVLEEALERLPQAAELWEAQVELALLQGDEERARQLLDEWAQLARRTSNLELRRMRLDKEIPLLGLMHDGLEAAMKEVHRADGTELEPGAMALDEAYFVLDFAARQYLPDGSTWTLTHMLVRVMTKGAIDRFGEQVIPQGAELLLARTIKESGEVRVPEEVPGKSTLSMPGLAEGDFVELAYLQFEEPGEIGAHSEGMQFYFQMSHISTRHSEYILVGADDLRLERANGAPEAEEFEWQGERALRLVARDRRRPRRELRAVNGEEYLPWAREYRVGVQGEVLDVERRYYTDALLGSTKSGPLLVKKVEEWLGRPLSEGALSDREVKDLYYSVADHFSRPSSGAVSVDALHSLQHRRGSPLVLLQAALKVAGVKSDIYLARTDEVYPKRGGISEFGYFRQPLMGLELPESGEFVWLEMDRRDAMFGALEADVSGQRAICISCEDFWEETVYLERERRPRRHLEVRGRLDEEGDLVGQLTYRFEGARAVNVRAALRSRPDEADRRDYFERILTADFAGAELVGSEVRGELERDRPLELALEFRRPRFARKTADRLVVDETLLGEAMEAIYAPLAERELPLFVGYEREQSASVQISLPEGFVARLRARDIEVEGVADFERRAWIEEGKLRLETSIYLPRQRVMPEDYRAFRAWARGVEESARVWLELR